MKSKYNVLLVASSVMQDAVRQVLIGNSDFSLLCAEDSAQAIAFLKQHPVQLILSEIDIGAIDGWRLARLVRANVLQCDEATPFILLSATYCERITETTARAYGINAVLPTVQLNALPEVLARFFAHATTPATTSNHLDCGR